jgi:hypothetical protein
MIAAITKIQDSFASVVYYMEKKINDGSGSIFFNNTFTENLTPNSIINDLSEPLSLNQKISKNIGMHISLNLNPNENLSDDKFKNLIDDYLNDLGWNNSPYVAYKHTDSNHPHIHIVLSSVNWEGKKLNDSYYKLRSQKLSRELEKKYNLKFTSYDLSEKAKINLNELNFRKYYVDKAVKKALRDYSKKDFFKKFFDDSQIKNIRYNALTNDDYKKLLNNNYDEMLSFLHQSKYFNSLLKDELKEKLIKIYNKSDNINDFFYKLNQSNIYNRKIFIKGIPRFIYGLKDDNFYVDDRSLNKEFKYDYISKNNNFNLNKIQFQADNDKMEFIKRNVYFALKKSPTLSIFNFHLQQKGIETIAYENSKGIYGLSFKLANDSDNSVFKASDINRNLSWNHIKNDIQINFEKTSVTEIKNQYNDIPNVDYTTPIPNNLGYIPPTHSGPNRDELEQQKKKKKRRKRNDNNLNR